VRSQASGFHCRKTCCWLCCWLYHCWRWMCCCGCFVFASVCPVGVFYFSPAQRDKKRSTGRQSRTRAARVGRPERQARQVPNTHSGLARSRRSSRTDYTRPARWAVHPCEPKWGQVARQRRIGFAVAFSLLRENAGVRYAVYLNIRRCHRTSLKGSLH
jgi:hypothetical protein